MGSWGKASRGNSQREKYWSGCGKGGGGRDIGEAIVLDGNGELEKRMGTHWEPW